MNAQFETDPEKALKSHAANIQRIAIGYGTGSLVLRARCGHQTAAGVICAACERSSENLHYFSVALAVVAAAADQGKAAELYEILTKFGAENLPGFPKGVSERPLYKSDMEFPSEIDDWK